MSSGLYIQESTTKKEWEGERVWINLTALGFQAAHLKRREDVIKSRLKNQGSTGIVESDDEDDGEMNTGSDDDDDDVEEIKSESNSGVKYNSGDKDVENPSAVASSLRGSSGVSFRDSANRNKVLANQWLHHMALADDMTSERNGVKVRNIEGLAGVDYLSPGVMTSLVSYVFGPVIVALKKAGYEAGKSLDAAPYDWRLSPSTLETRDQYFTRTMTQIEEMYEKNDNTPIVMVCHSMGCKTGHYLLNFAKNAKGQEWLDKHIHTYCPVGAPHLGAPKALRSFVSGDKMGLETFLSDSEALAMGRSLGSGVWLMPAEIPPESPPTAILRSDWALEVTLMSAIDTSVFLDQREDGSKPKRMKITVTFNGKAASTPMHPIDEQELVTIGETFQLRTHEELREKVCMTIMLCEPGLSRARKSKSKLRDAHLCCRNTFFNRWRIMSDGEEQYRWGRPPKANKVLFWINILTFWWLIWPILRYGIEFGFKLSFGAVYCALWCLFEGTILSANEVAQVSKSCMVTAFARIQNVREVVLQGGSTNDAHEVVLDVDLISNRDRRWVRCCRQNRTLTIKVKLKWISPKSLAHPRKSVSQVICQPTTLKLPVLGKEIHSKKAPEAKYLSRSGYDLLDAEGLGTRIFKHMNKIYDSDAFDPRGLSSTVPPPIKRVKAIYGINRPTEVSSVYRRRSTMVLGLGTREVNTFHLDRTAAFTEEKPGFEVKGGIIFETQTDDRPSGDGTVPYWSLNYAKNWRSSCEVTIDEVEGAEHRDILADRRFHNLLIDYCGPKEIVVDSKIDTVVSKIDP